MQINSIGNINSSKRHTCHRGKAEYIKELGHLFDTDHRILMLERKEIHGISNPKNLKALDELFEFFEGHLSRDIYRAYYAIMDANDEVNNYAKKALFALTNGKSPNIITNFRNINKFSSHSYSRGLDHLADLIQSCKDNGENHNKKALDVLGEFEVSGMNSFSIPHYIKFCKDKDGKFDSKRVDIVRDFTSKGYIFGSEIIEDVPNSENIVTQARLDFFYHIMKKYNKDIHADIMKLAQELLQKTKDSRSDNEIKMLDEHFEELLNDDKSVKWWGDYFKAFNGKINTVNIEKMIHDVIPALKDRGFNYVKFPPDLLKDEMGDIIYYNIDEYLKLITAYKFSNKFIEELSPVINETKMGLGFIDTNLINFITNNAFYFRETTQIPYPVEILKEVLRISKDKDGKIDWEVANNILEPIYLLFRKKGEELQNPIIIKPENNANNLYKEVYTYCSLLEKAIKGGGVGNIGEFSKEQIEYIKRVSGGNDGTEFLVKALSGKTIDELIKNKNLYKADELLEVMEELNKTGRLNKDSLNTQIKDFESIFWAIIEAPKTEENKETYKKVMKLLSTVKGIDYNQKDKNNITVLEKVIIAENEELLDIIIDNSNELHYYPELDWAIDGIQNKTFKDKLKRINLKFKDLEQSAELCSIKTFDRLKTQFDSPLCNKNCVIEKLFRIVKEQKGTIEPPDVYVYRLLDEYGEYLSRDLFNEMASWQISERTKRLSL